MESITIQVERELFRFSSFMQWVNKGKSWLATCGVPSHKTICVDAKGRICVSGKEFMRARDDEAFPICVYSIVD